VIWLGLLACRPEVCTTNPETLPVYGAEGDESVVLDDVWQGFAAAVAPAELCVTAAEVWSVRDWRVDGRYRSVRRNIWVGRDASEQMATALRHELCHAFDQQVLGGPLPDEFTVEVRLAGRHPGKLPSREAFAWTCSLEPTLVPVYAAASCGSELGSSAFAWVADEVYAAHPEVPEHAVDRVEVPLPELVTDRPVATVEAFVEAPGAIGVLLGFEDTDVTELAWIDLVRGAVSRAGPEGAVGLVPLASAGEPPLTSPLSLPYHTASSDRTDVAWVETALLAGYTRRQLVRRDGGAWGAAPDACGIPLDQRTSFFLRGSARELTSVSAVEDRLVVIGWDGPLGE